MGKYASNTTVSIEKSQSEVQNILRKYGADAFGVMERKNSAYLMFEYNNLIIQITVPLPQKDEFMKTESGRIRKTNQVNQSYEQAIRQRWRALVLAIKAKLEAVESGISTLEKEFLAFVIMPDGESLGNHLLPQLQQIANTGKMPKLLNWEE